MERPDNYGIDDIENCKDNIGLISNIWESRESNSTTMRLLRESVTATNAATFTRIFNGTLAGTYRPYLGSTKDIR